MFRKIVSNLPFSPALVGQLGFYANRLRREEATRRAGLIFVVLALVVQSFAVFAPPESANAANGNNVIYGGVNNKAELLDIVAKDKDSAGHKDIVEIYKQFGITASDIKNASVAHINSRDFNDKVLSVGRSSSVGHQRTAIKIDDTSSTVYEGYLHDFDSHDWSKQHGTTYEAVVGKRAVDGKWFAVMFDCGNPVYLEHPPVQKPPVAACSYLRMAALSRTDYRFDAKASIDNGATISSYGFTVKDKSGKTIATKSVNSKETSASTTYTFPSDGTYSVVLSVQTSLGAKSGNDCTKAVTVSPQPLCVLNADYTSTSPECKPCENDKTVWYKDEKCTSQFQTTKTVRNVTTLLADANNKTAAAGDRLEYHLSVKNTGNKTGNYTISDNLSDVLEYADLVDNGGGTVTTASATTPVESQGAITWPEIELKPGQTITKIIIVQIKSEIPATPQNAGNPDSYNCALTNNFKGIHTNVMVDCPTPKAIEQVVDQLPQTGPGENMLFAGAALAVVVFFYARSRQLKKEVRLIRRDLNAGTI